MSELSTTESLLDIVPSKKPSFSSMVCLEDRQKTFNHYPKVLEPLSERMSDTGLFYSGYSDWVTCYQCGIIIGEWKLEDDPSVEHAFFSSDCYLSKMSADTKQNEKVIARGSIGPNSSDNADEKPVAPQPSVRDDDPPEQERAAALEAERRREAHASSGCTCVVCLDRQIDMTFLPCGHLSCSGCFLRLKEKKCFVCRVDILYTKRIYFS